MAGQPHAGRDRHFATRPGAHRTRSALCDTVLPGQRSSAPTGTDCTCGNTNGTSSATPELCRKVPISSITPPTVSQSPDFVHRTIHPGQWGLNRAGGDCEDRPTANQPPQSQAHRRCPRGSNRRKRTPTAPGYRGHSDKPSSSEYLGPQSSIRVLQPADTCRP